MPNPSHRPQQRAATEACFDSQDLPNCSFALLTQTSFAGPASGRPASLRMRRACRRNWSMRSRASWSFGISTAGPSGKPKCGRIPHALSLSLRNVTANLRATSPVRRTVLGLSRHPRLRADTAGRPRQWWRAVALCGACRRPRGTADAAVFRQPVSDEVQRSFDAMKVASALREAVWGMVSAIHLAVPGADYRAHAADYRSGRNGPKFSWRARV